ncbi:MAG: T9SS type A sorting domain-containing protein [Bacteroidia bacterium]|nr:T9SS type A sorting domain-containing protein [Bacteroidia bacterium]MCF8446091.1 T9SS type A sorting domain-containing protein [Bacteroidia bacterium]
MKNIFAITLFCLLAIGRLYSQTGCCPYINGITIIPKSPTTNDTIKIVTTTTTPNLGIKISYTHSQQSDTFNLVGCFWEGMFTQLKTFLDTTNIGLLTAGNYYVNYIAYSSISSTSSSVIDTNSMTTSFVVTATSGLENLNDNHFSIYPNPFSMQTVLQTEKSFHNATLTVDNYFGQTVKEIKNISDQTVTLQRDNLPEGLYFVRLTENNKIIATKKIVIMD